MRMRDGAIILGALVMAMAMTTACADDQPVKFSHPDRVRYDGQCFTIEGKDTFIFSGAFHYFRCPKPLWRERFRKIKEAGFNAVETYVAWNWHEREMPAGLDDFSKIVLKDIDDWLTMAEEDFGLYTIVRPGPYICAEWDVGGFPRWLSEKVPADPKHTPWFRTDDPDFIAWSKHWYDAVCPVIAKHQITRKPVGKPGVILFQLENEYDFSGKDPESIKFNYLKALAKIAVADGIDVPLFTCWTKMHRGTKDPVVSQVFDTCNFYPRWGIDGVRKALEELHEAQPHAPIMVTELQGGWFSNVGGQLSDEQDGISAAQISNLTLFVIQQGLTSLNYYMLFGGTNLGDWAARNITTTYDYYAPLRECGGVAEKYRAVKAIGMMLREHGQALARSVAVECDVNTGREDVELAMRRSPSGAAYVFLRSRTGNERQGLAVIRPRDGKGPGLCFGYELMPHDSKILFMAPGAKSLAEGKWLPESAGVAPVACSPCPMPIRISTALKRTETDEAKWVPVELGKSLSSVGVNDNRFVLYRTRLQAPAASWAEYQKISVKLLAQDAVVLSLNGQVIEPAASSGTRSDFPVAGVLHAGENRLELLYENHARANGGPGMEERKGIAEVRLASKRVEGMPLRDWKIKRVDGTEPRPEIAADFDDSKWEQVAVHTESWQKQMQGNGTVCVFRNTIELSQADLDAGETFLEFDGIDDQGWIYVNGKEIGEAHDWRDAFVFDARGALHVGKNVIAVVVRNEQGPGGINKDVRLAKEGKNGITLSSWELAPALGGVAGRWWDPGLDDGNWTKTMLDTAKALSVKHDPKSISDLPQGPAEAPVTWYRVRFELPETPGAWMPWLIRLDASGNGFLYLNGEELGRYWEVGPQREFYLPECWLKFGAGQTNVLTLCLRPTKNGAVLRAAEVLPYGEFTEGR